MGAMQSAGLRGCQLGTVALALAALVAPVQPSHAGAPRPSHGDWLGAWRGLEIRGGLGAAEGGFSGLGGISGRLATLLSLVDVDLGVTVRGGGPRPDDAAVTVVSPAVEARAHPLFMRHLRGDWTLAALYVSLGVGADVMARSQRPGLAAGIALRVGLGGDVPLTRPSDGGPSVWLGLGYRLRISAVPAAPPGLRDQDGHELWTSLSIRWHGVDFMRVPRPPELDDRER
jgi:hypothetical protein